MFLLNKGIQAATFWSEAPCFFSHFFVKLLDASFFSSFSSLSVVTFCQAPQWFEVAGDPPAYRFLRESHRQDSNTLNTAVKAHLKQSTQVPKLVIDEFFCTPQNYYHVLPAASSKHIGPSWDLTQCPIFKNLYIGAATVPSYCDSSFASWIWQGAQPLPEERRRQLVQEIIYHLPGEA